ncbi:DJ-1 family glyoxalase III [Celerinatantimonas sp. YJH-8]|uniref:DJ-1 family glyoxalase III n=1 Tax=Celerinatantimonas sp. YJH-8 TaxID=3228714 RepID=UPI0038C074DA
MVDVMVAVAPGCEEIETVGIVDTLRRAQFDVDLVSVGDELTVECSRRIRLTADKLLDEVKPGDYQLLVLPGGAPGCEYMKNHPQFIQFIRDFYHAPNYLAAICAAPAAVLQTHHIAPGAIKTCHPDYFKDLPSDKRSEQRVVIDAEARLITSRGPGTAIEFALAIIKELAGSTLAEQVAKPMLNQA